MSAERPTDEVDPVPAAEGLDFGDPMERVAEAEKRRARAMELLAENQGLEGRVADLQRAIAREPELKPAPLSARKEEVVAEIAPSGFTQDRAPKIEAETVVVRDAIDDPPSERRRAARDTTVRVAVPRVADANASHGGAGRGTAIVGIACVVILAGFVAFFVVRGGTTAASNSSAPSAKAAEVPSMSAGVPVPSDTSSSAAAPPLPSVPASAPSVVPSVAPSIPPTVRTTAPLPIPTNTGEAPLFDVPTRGRK